MAGAFRRFAVNIRTSEDTTPNARIAYTVGRTPPRSPLMPLDARQAMAPAASPQREEIVRDPDVTSSRAPHFGHTISFEYAAVSGAGISVLQWGQIRTATCYLRVWSLPIIS